MHFHKWLQWSDVQVFGFGYAKYLLQGRKCDTCKITKFRVAKTRNPVSVIESYELSQADLQKACLWDQGGK